jgi:hypothetical protein
MKKSTLLNLVIIALFTLGAVACNKSSDNNEHYNDEVTDESGEALPIGTEVTPQSDTALEAHVHFACPMQCEEDKMYHEDIPCPDCKMKLKEVKHDGH